MLNNHPVVLNHAYLTNGFAFSLANKLFLKVADLAALAEDYYKAIQNYERVAKSSVSNNLMKWSVKDYFLKSGVCLLANNVRNRQCHPSLYKLANPPLGHGGNAECSGALS